MVKWFKALFKTSKISAAQEAYMKGKLRPVENPSFAINGGRPISINVGRIEIPEFTKELAKYAGQDLSTYVERFLVTCLYMEQGMHINNGIGGYVRLTPGKPEWFSHSNGPKNPRSC